MKIRDLEVLLCQRGYSVRPGKGSHRIWSHPFRSSRPIVLHGRACDDAHPYQVRRVCKAS